MVPICNYFFQYLNKINLTDQDIWTTCVYALNTLPLEIKLNHTIPFINTHAQRSEVVVLPDFGLYFRVDIFLIDL